MTRELRRRMRVERSIHRLRLRHLPDPALQQREVTEGIRGDARLHVGISPPLRLFARRAVHERIEQTVQLRVPRDGPDLIQPLIAALERADFLHRRMHLPQRHMPDIQRLDDIPKHQRRIPKPEVLKRFPSLRARPAPIPKCRCLLADLLPSRRPRQQRRRTGLIHLIAEDHIDDLPARRIRDIEHDVPGPIRAQIQHQHHEFRFGRQRDRRHLPILRQHRRRSFERASLLFARLLFQQVIDIRRRLIPGSALPFERPDDRHKILDMIHQQRHPARLHLQPRMTTHRSRHPRLIPPLLARARIPRLHPIRLVHARVKMFLKPHLHTQPRRLFSPCLSLAT